MPSAREMLLATRDNRRAYDAWRAAIELLAFGVTTGIPTRTMLTIEVHQDVVAEVNETPALLWHSPAATLAALYMLGGGRHRGIVAAKVAEIRLAS